MFGLTFIVPDWPAPAAVKTLQTTRLGGVSGTPFFNLNLGDHVGDKSISVARNRMLLSTYLPSEPVWLKQVHGTLVVDASACANCVPQADASFSRQPNSVCVVMTADCLPILFCNNAGTVVGAAHAGWRG